MNQFTQLEHLCLSATINDLNIISNLTQLHDLDIIQSDERELANIEVLKKFENLNMLGLINCNISDIEVLSDLEHLVLLNLEKINSLFKFVSKKEESFWHFYI